MSNLSSINEGNPIRLVLLGGSGVGKSTFANLASSRYFRETYYPTHKSTVLLFEFVANTLKSKSLLDEYGGIEAKKVVGKDGDLILSPTIFQSFTKVSDDVKRRTRKRSSSSNGSKSKLIKNKYYAYRYKPADSNNNDDNDNNGNVEDDDNEDSYVEPEISPITVELIDTPPFKPDLVVPFLEVSLFRNLDKEDLHNLANEPRRPVSTNPLLVASGSGELNGNVNGYIFMYSAVPTFNPPTYEDAISPQSPEDSSPSEAITAAGANELNIKTSRSNSEDSLSLLEIIRGAILDAWKEYRSYQKRRDKGTEGDIYSLIYGIKQLWRNKSSEDEQKRLNELRKISNHLDELDIDPTSPDSPPPILIVCTHSNHPYHSPRLIEQGKNLANAWKCSFIQVDNEDGENIDETFSLIIREILEREKLQKLNKKLFR